MVGMIGTIAEGRTFFAAQLKELNGISKALRKEAMFARPDFEQSVYDVRNAISEIDCISQDYGLDWDKDDELTLKYVRALVHLDIAFPSILDMPTAIMWPCDFVNLGLDMAFKSGGFPGSPKSIIYDILSSPPPKHFRAETDKTLLKHSVSVTTKPFKSIAQIFELQCEFPGIEIGFSVFRPDESYKPMVLTTIGEEGFIRYPLGAYAAFSSHTHTYHADDNADRPSAVEASNLDISNAQKAYTTSGKRNSVMTFNSNGSIEFGLYDPGTDQYVYFRDDQSEVERILQRFGLMF